ncbi:MAG: methyltransferase domain-containing protein [Chlamydiales bacterium]|nr:methyltransferase domain-containing protein [Chlamydiales bacterium]
MTKIDIFKCQAPELSEAWAAEYKRQGIPSSFRKDPSNALVEFISWLEKQDGNEKQKAADLGCGLGRNSFYLVSRGFSVTAIDLLQSNADAINEEAKQTKLPVIAFAQDVSSKWPIASHSLDIAIDVFCYKHITNKEAQKNYRRQLWKALKPNGFYFISLASINDGFYGPLLQHSPSPKEKLVIDPYANIASYLYSLVDLSNEFGDMFTVIEASEKTSSSPMHGKDYTRKVLNVILQKRLL